MDPGGCQLGMSVLSWVAQSFQTFQGSLDLLGPWRSYFYPIYNTSKSSWVSAFLISTLAASALSYPEKVLCGSGWINSRPSSVLRFAQELLLQKPLLSSKRANSQVLGTRSQKEAILQPLMA